MDSFYVAWLIGMILEINGAHIRTRTGDLFLTKEVLYLLSYVGKTGAGNGTRTRDPQLGRLTL